MKSVQKTRVTPIALLTAAVLALTACSPGETDDAESAGFLKKGLSIVAGSGTGSGYDQSARAIEQALTDERLVNRVQVTNKEGAGGTVALADFINVKGANQLMLSGLSTIGAAITNDSPVTLSDVTPVARLIGEYDVIVVPKESPFKTLKEFLTALEKDPGANPIAIGNQGGYDHQWGGLLVQEAGLKPTDVNFVTFDGGGEALIALLGNQVAAGISGYGEFAASIDSGDVRVLATASDEPLDVAPDLPTIADAGYPDAALVNWRGVFAPPNVSEDELEALEDLFAKLVKSEAWKNQLKTKGWSDEYLAGDDFAEAIADSEKQTLSLLQSLGLV